MRTIKQSTAYDLMVFMADSSDHVTGKTGLTLTITASKAGGAYSSISPTVTERGTGSYSIALTTSHTDTLGDLALKITATGADPTDVFTQVRANVLGDTQPSNVTQWSGTNVASVDTAGYPKVTVKSGTGTGEISLSSGVVKATDAKGNPLIPLSSGQVIRRSADGTITYYIPASGTAAARGDAIIAAKNAASSGETIFILFDATVTETLWADGVNWYIADGCNLHGTAAEGLFVDAATGEEGDPLVPATFSINGGGVITSTSVPIIAGVNSKIRVHCRSVTATTGTNQAVNASGSGAEIWITATEKIQSVGYDCLLATSGGKIHAWTPYCQSAGVGGNCVDIANTGSIVDGWVGRMKSEDTAIHCVSSGGVVNLVIGSIEVTTDKSLVNVGCDVKIVCPSIVGQVVHTTGNTRLVGPTTIDTTAFSLASVTVAASGLVLENARIVTKSSETNSMSAASAQTVQVARAIEYNKALSNVTLSYVDSIGVIGSDAITAAAIADGAIDTATFATGATLPRVTLVDTTTTNTDMAAVKSQTDKIGTNDADSPDDDTMQATVALNLDAKISEIDAGGASAPDVTIEETDVEITTE